MSLQIIANHLAQKGRGPDTTLVHMAPKEVASLQDLAQRHGGSLTTNPHTGLPEAGFLESLLPMALGAGAMMLPGMQGVGAGYIGAGIGALQGLRTGSLKQGLLAGLGAYGGASMAGGLLGSGAMEGIQGGQDQMALLQQQQAIAADKATPILARQAAEQQAAELSKQIAQQQAKALANDASKSFMENLSSNFSKAGSGLTRGFGNFSNSVGMVPGSIGLKTALGAAAIPALMSAYDDSSENGVPTQKTNDADLGAYAKSGAKFYPNYVGPYESKVPGGEYTYARPYYGAEGGAVGMADGGVTGMAMGGMPQRDAYQEYMDYYNNSFPPVSKEATTVAPFQYTTPTPAPAPTAPAAMPFLETPVSSNTRQGGGGRGEKPEPGFFDGMSESDQARHFSYSPFASAIGQGINRGMKYSTSSLIPRILGGSDEFDAMMDRKYDVLQGYDPANVVPVMEGYTRISPPDQHRLTVKESDALSNDQSNAKIARIIAEAQAAAYPNTPPPGTVPTSRITAAPAGTLGSAPPQGDPRQMQEAAREASGFVGSGAERGSSPTADRGATNSENPGWGSRDAGANGGLSTSHGFQRMAQGGISSLNQYNLGSYSDGGRLLKGPGDGVSDSIPAVIGKRQPARLADGEFVIPARIVSEIGNGSTEAGARKLYAMMDRIQKGRRKTVGRGKVAVNSRADRYLPA